MREEKGSIMFENREPLTQLNTPDTASTQTQDIQAHQSGELAVFTSDTVEHDILPIGNTEVGVYNLCTDTTRHMNGVVANMQPSEGVWLFRYILPNPKDSETGRGPRSEERRRPMSHAS